MSDTQQIRTYLAEAPRWGAEMAALRDIALSCGLDEAIKWRKPCFTHAGGNIAILQPFVDDCRLMFFKGVLLPDPAGLLTSQGDNTQAARSVRITALPQVARLAPAIRALIGAAMAAEAAGLQPSFPNRHALDLPAELVGALDADPDLARAWSGLTPGRQRSWVLHIGAARQGATRAARIDSATPAILAGRGRNER